jgi:hypothetical protein
METNLSSRILMRTAPMMVLCGLLASGAIFFAVAQSDCGRVRNDGQEGCVSVHID